MNFLNKIEDLINKLLIRFQSFFWIFLQKITPQKIKTIIEKLVFKRDLFVIWSKALPARIKIFVLATIVKIKSLLADLDIKSKLKSTYQAALAKTNTDEKEVKGKFKALKKFFMVPVLIVGQWLQGLSTAQSLLLLTFTAASVLSVFSISFEGNRLLKQIETSRSPASIEEEEYSRPKYYKKETRHLSFTSFRLPVYVPQVNELKSIDIDFIATLSNREARNWLSKREFQFRDHLISNIEPLAASFPLEEEGKEIIRQKLIVEIDQFLIENKINAHVTELKISYMLAN